MFNEREHPTGEAFVEFASSDDRERAMTKDRQHMGGRYAAPLTCHPTRP
jgi:heterogeneous nuclear ribonucleoprotein F/H